MYYYHKHVPVTILFLLVAFTAFCQSSFPYKNPKLPVEQRVNDLLKRMTIEEKFYQLFMVPGDLDEGDTGKYKHGIFGLQVHATAAGDANGQMLRYNANEKSLDLVKKMNFIQSYFLKKTRLGIPIIPFDEGLHGVVREGATSFPQAIALAATWDTALMHRASIAAALEARARGLRDVLSPVINLATDVRWGRTEETYGEDPYLSAAMGVAFVKGFEENGVITTPKHFVANVGDGGRDSYPIHYSERFLDETYFVPFKACVQEGKARSIMTAYNSLNGIACSSNKWLLTEKLKKQWGFNGFVISDANAVGGEVVLHNTADSYATAGEHAINAGLDVIFQTDYAHAQLFLPAFLNKKINSQRLDDAVRRVLRAKFELGLFEHPYVDEQWATKVFADTTSRWLAKKAAQESIVLLKNKDQLLPLQRSTRTIAVIGEDAVAARLGGYSGPGNNKISILEGIRNKVGNSSTILYSEGASVLSKDWEVVPANYLTHDGQPGLRGAYYDNIHFDGTPAVVRTDKTIDYSWTLFGPDSKLSNNWYAVRWTGELVSPKTGTFKIGLKGNDGFRLYIDDRLIIDHWNKESYHTDLQDFNFEKDRSYKLRVEFYEPVGNAHVQLIWNVTTENDWEQKIAQAVQEAGKADVAVVVAGIHEGEFQDRASLALPGHQEELIQAIAKTGKPFVVVLVGGSAVTMNNWLPRANAVLDAWYGGDCGGDAVTDVLFGDYNPAGRLPITFPVSEAQLPLYYYHQPTGRGDDYYNLSGEPLFPFGFGLSYTKFEYSDLKFRDTVIKKNASTTVSCRIKNTGAYDGDEVVQLYTTDILSSLAQPVQQLKGFQRIHLKAGEEKEVSFAITPETLQILNEKMQWTVEPGRFRIMIGASARDIRLKGSLKVIK